MLHTVEVSPADDCPAAPILAMLHGYGADESDLVGLAPMLDPRLRAVGIRGPIELPQGGHAWFPIEYTESGLVVNFEEVNIARVQICGIVGDLERSFPKSRGIFLLGFSQGAGMALYSAFHIPDSVVGIASLSGLCVEEMLPDGDQREALDDKSVFMSHGQYDSLIPIENGRRSHEMLSALPLQISYYEYRMGHEINQECLMDLREWLQDRINELTP